MDIFSLFENTQQGNANSRRNFLQELRFFSDSELLKTDASGQNILHKILADEFISYDVVEFILKNKPQLANMPDAQGYFPAQKIQKNPITDYRAIKALLSEKTDNLDIKKKLLYQSDIQIGCPQITTNEIDATNIEDFFEPIDIENAQTIFEKPTLICFSGRGAICEKIAAQFAQACSKAFYLYQKPLANFQILSGWYPGTERDLETDTHAFRSPFLQADADSPYFYADRFVKRFLRPLYMENDRKRPFRIAQKNLRNINIFAYSYGASVVQLISDCLWKDMISVAEFSETQAKILQKQIFLLTAGANINANYYKNYFSAYHIMNTEDEVVFPLIRPLLKVKKLRENAFAEVSLFQQPNQAVLLFSDKCSGFWHNPHHITSYFPKECSSEGHKKMLLLKDYILTNAINNSIENTTDNNFIPLQKLEEKPTKCLFLKNQKDQIERLASFQDKEPPRKILSRCLAKLDFTQQKIKE